MVTVLVVHIVLPNGVVGLVPFSLSWWLWVGGVALMWLPICGVGMSGVGQLWTMVVGSCWIGTVR